MALLHSKTVEALAKENPKLLVLFRKFDRNGEGKLNAEEIRQMMAMIGMSHGTEAVQEAISAADADSDGYVEFDEFVAMMKRAEELKSSKSTEAKAWTQLSAKRTNVLCWVTFPGAMVVLIAFGSIFSLHYIASVDEAIRSVNGIFDVVWRMTGGVGESQCPASLPDCSLASTSKDTHWPGAGYIADNYERHSCVLLVHIVTVSTAFLIFPFQFWKGLRAWSVEQGNRVHAYMGRTAIVLLVLVAMPSSTVIAGGPAGSDMLSRAGFFCMALAVTFTALMGWKCVRQKDYAEHKKWMTRCFGTLLGGFFIFRMEVAFLTRLPFNISWPILCWNSWIAGLVLAEIYLRRTAQDEKIYLDLIASGRAGRLSQNQQAHKDTA